MPCTEILEAVWKPAVTMQARDLYQPFPCIRLTQHILFWLKKALGLAQEEGCVVSTHFMESSAERAWIDEGSMIFKPFLAPLIHMQKPLCQGSEYLSLFEHNRTLFTHGVHATDDELSTIAHQKQR